MLHILEHNMHPFLCFQGVLACVQKRGQGNKLALVCSCGENVGDFVAYKKELKYWLDLGKVKR
jgi:hypothetical protein